MDNFDLSEDARLFFRSLEDRHHAEFTVKNKNPTESLARLAGIADSDHETSEVVSKFLLGLYNGHAFPFRLGTLRDLDMQTWHDCVAVLAMDHQIVGGTVSPYTPNGEKLFAKLLTRFQSQMEIK